MILIHKYEVRRLLVLSQPIPFKTTSQITFLFGVLRFPKVPKLRPFVVMEKAKCTPRPVSNIGGMTLTEESASIRKKNLTECHTV